MTTFRFRPSLLEHPAMLYLVTGLIAVRGAVLIVAAWPFTVDDAYITLRYAKHLAGGQGIVWNLGEHPPVEGYSNFLYVLLGAVSYRIGLDPIAVYKGLGVVALAVSVWLMHRMARAWVGPLPALAPAILFTSFFGPSWWAVSGLETLSYVALVLAAVAAAFTGLGFQAWPATGRADHRDAWFACSGALVALAAMTHPEGPVVGAAIAAGILVGTRSTRSVAVFVAAAALPYGIYFLWRWSYFQRLLPNPVYCKGGFEGYPLGLVEDLAVHAAPLMLMMAFAGWRRMDARHLVAIVLVLVYLCLLVGVDPILTQGSRHALAPLAVLLAVACGTILARFSPAAGSGVTVLAFCLSTVLMLGLPGELRDKGLSYARRTEARLGIGRWIDRTTSANESYVMGDAGAVTAATERRMIDAYCLNAGVMTLPPINRSGARYAGWILEQRPGVIVVPSYSPDSLAVHGYMGVFPALVQDNTFLARYRHVQTVNVPGTIFHYWIYVRGQTAPAAKP
ncbi:MAG: hypothetical protein ACREOQ_15065 [Gemmatimonadales bacterium]